MKYATVCSGIEAPSAAWKDWEPVFFSEVDKFPKAVLKHHYPNVPDLGDMKEIDGEKYRGSIDIIFGGTPCQGFSLAGKRGGLDDERSGLAMHFIRLVSEIQPRWVVWENVPGCFSCWSDETRSPEVYDADHIEEVEAANWFSVAEQRNDFEAFTSSLVECGYHLAYRVLNAQYFGVPQRRRRIFVVGYLGDWRPAGAVLFERPGMSWDTKPGRKAREEPSSKVAACLNSGGNDGGFRTEPGEHLVAQPITTRPYSDRGAADESKLVAGTLCNSGKASGSATQQDAENNMLVCVDSRQDPNTVEDKSLPLNANLPTHAICYENHAQDSRVKDCGDISPSISAKAGTGGGNLPLCQQGMSVRRLTPLECERLQGFPYNYTNIPFGRPSGPDVLCPDSLRYKALGNSIAVPVLEWIGKRIEMVERLND